MKIELKNIKVNLTFSEETTQFRGVVYIDGVEAAHAENDGRGGSTFYRPCEGKRGLVETAEQYCKKLPFEKTPYGEFPQSLETVIDNLVTEYCYKKEKESFKKKLLKAIEKGIVYGDENKFNTLSWKGHTIKSLLARPDGVMVLKTEVMKLKRKGETILNTNLPFEI